MDTSELVTTAQEEASIAPQSTEWDSTKLLQLMNQMLVEGFEPIIGAGRGGLWTHTLTRTLGANNSVVRLPPRTAGFIQADIRLGTGKWCPLQEHTEADQQDWERLSASYPVAFIRRGSTLHLTPAAIDGQCSMRVKIVVRPSTLYLPQTTGKVASVDLNTNIITLVNLPVDKATSSTISGTLNVDVVEPDDNFELSLFHAQATVLSSTTVQIASGYNLAKIQAGDYMRVANQSEWPNMPKPFHHLLAKAAAITPCIQRDLYDRANDLRQSVAAGINRLIEHVKPVVRANTQERKPIQHSWE